MKLHFEAEVTSDRKLVLTLPPDVPLGKVAVDVTIPSAGTSKGNGTTSLTEWARQNAGEYHDSFNSEDVEGFTGRRF